MGKRRTAREQALRFLYQGELNEGSLEEQLDSFLDQSPCTPEVQEYMFPLVRDILDQREAVDSCLQKCSENWSLSRMSIIDRNILRIAVFEIMFRKDVPVKVAIDEAVEIAKVYGTEDSPDFINGVLDRAKKEMEKDLAESAPS